MTLTVISLYIFPYKHCFYTYNLAYESHVCSRAIDIEAQKGRTTKFSPPSSPGQSISQPAIEFGKTMRDLIDILQSADHALKRMLVAFEHMAHYIKNREYIAIVQSKEYKAVDSVRALFQLLAPHLKPVDCSLLKALVEAAGVEQAIQRLDEYIHMTSSGSGSEKVHTPYEMGTLSQISSQPVAVTEAKEMSWGTFRWIQSLLGNGTGVEQAIQRLDEYNCNPPDNSGEKAL